MNLIRPDSADADGLMHQLQVVRITCPKLWLSVTGIVSRPGLPAGPIRRRRYLAVVRGDLGPVSCLLSQYISHQLLKQRTQQVPSRITDTPELPIQQRNIKNVFINISAAKSTIMLQNLYPILMGERGYISCRRSCTSPPGRCMSETARPVLHPNQWGVGWWLDPEEGSDLEGEI